MRAKVRLPLVVGCDPSSKKLAFYVIDTIGNDTWGQTYQLPEKKSHAYSPVNASRAGVACENAVRMAGAMTHDRQPQYLFIEEPVVARGGIRSSLMQAYVNGVVQDHFHSAGYIVHITHQSTWKAAIGAKPSGGKQAVFDAMLANFPFDIEACDGDEDLLDAAAMARFGCQTLGRTD